MEQDDAEDCLGVAYFGDIILNNLQVEECLSVNCIKELNQGWNIDIQNNLDVWADINVSGCLYLNQPLLNLHNESGFDDKDIGFYGSYFESGITSYTGLVRNTNDINKPWILFDGGIGITDPCIGDVNFVGISYSDLHIGRLDIKQPLDQDSLKIQNTQYGDLMVGISGTFQTLSIGTENQILKTNLTSPLGVTWADNTATITLISESGNYIQTINNYDYTRLSSNITLLNSDVYTRVFRKKLYTNYIFSVINEIENGPIGLFNVSKSNKDIEGHIVKLSGFAGLRSKWERRSDIEISKCIYSYDGDYLALSNYDYSQTPNTQTNFYDTTTLSNTTYNIINSATKGNFIYQIENDINGPAGIFYLSKANPDFVGCIARISHSQSDDCNKLEMLWNANEGIKLHKTKSTYDGEYKIIPIHDQYLSEFIITLTDNNYTSETFIEQYERVSTIVSVESIDTNGTTAIFCVSKHNKESNAHIVKISGASSGIGWDNLEIIGVDPPSAPSNTLIVNNFEIVGVERKCGLSNSPDPENIEITWNADELMKIRKNNLGGGNSLYNGQYKVRIYDYFPT